MGCLTLYKNRELVFSQINEDSSLSLTNEALRDERNRVRDEISMIDAASAVLSMGGGKAFSVNSRTLS